MGLARSKAGDPRSDAATEIQYGERLSAMVAEAAEQRVFKCLNGASTTITGFGLSLMKALADGFRQPIRESNEVAGTITPIRDPTRLFATEKEANNAPLAMAMDWMNAN
jgi:hypothetical protein